MGMLLFMEGKRGDFIFSNILSQTKREENPGTPVNDFISAKAL